VLRPCPREAGAAGPKRPQPRRHPNVDGAQPVAREADGRTTTCSMYASLYIMLHVRYMCVVIRTG